LIRLLKTRGSNGLFLYLVLDASRANLAMVTGRPAVRPAPRRRARTGATNPLPRLPQATSRRPNGRAVASRGASPGVSPPGACRCRDRL
ncbi:hypothetical protein AB0O63_35425, partial [Streptomyces cyaneofuscatus]